MLESLYYVLTWACNRSCAHCYDERFRPYSDSALQDMLRRQEVALRRVIANLPERLGVTARAENGREEFMRGRIIISGGELLLPQVRERLLFPALELLRAKYPEDQVELVLQTGGDLLDAPLLDALLETGLGTISVSSIDSFHAGLHNETAAQRKERLTELFHSRAMRPSGVAAEGGNLGRARRTRMYNFFGATPEMWIGKLWPGGRAWRNGLSSAGYEDNFCAAWSGAKGFLNLGQAGSEVAIDPEGRLYPCCRKTALPYGDLTQHKLEDVLRELAAKPAFRALASGSPEAMARCYGVASEEFRAMCRAVTPKGASYANPCLGCDVLHRRFVAAELDPALGTALEERTPGRENPACTAVS